MHEFFCRGAFLISNSIMDLTLNRSIAFFDLETTGVNIAKDRIVEISILRVYPDNTEKIITHLVNPTIAIPENTSKIHGIYDKDVKDKPTFKELAGELSAFLANCDLAGYNIIKFDLPLIVEEFLRADVDFDLENRRILDVQNIFHKMEPRNLKAAYRFYCGETLDNAHSAEADTIATYKILKAQIDRYSDVAYEDNEGNITFPVKNDIASLSSFSHYTRNVDLVGHIILSDKGVEIFNFGKYKRKPVEEVFEKEPQYYDWMMKSDFPLSTKKVITAIYMRGFNKGDNSMK